MSPTGLHWKYNEGDSVDVGKKRYIMNPYALSLDRLFWYYHLKRGLGNEYKTPYRLEEISYWEEDYITGISFFFFFLLYNIVLVSVIHHTNQPQVYMCPLLPEAPSHHPMFIAAFFTIARTWKQPRYPVTRMDTEIVVHIYSGMLLSFKKECIWVSLNEVEEPRAYSTDKSKSERERISFDFQNHVPWHHSLRMNLSPMIVWLLT